MYVHSISRYVRPLNIQVCTSTQYPGLYVHSIFRYVLHVASLLGLPHASIASNKLWGEKRLSDGPSAAHIWVVPGMFLELTQKNWSEFGMYTMLNMK